MHETARPAVVHLLRGLLPIELDRCTIPGINFAEWPVPLKAFPENIIPWLLLTGAAALCIYAPFSSWAINAASLGRHDMGLAIFFSVTFPVAVYAACAITMISILLAPFYRKSGRRGRNMLLIAALTGILPFACIWILDVAGANVA